MRNIFTSIPFHLCVLVCVCIFVSKKEYDFLLYERRHNQNMRCSIFGFFVLKLLFEYLYP